MHGVIIVPHGNAPRYGGGRQTSPKAIRVPGEFKVALKGWAKKAGASVNALVKKSLHTRYHCKELPRPTSPPTEWLHLRVAHDEWLALKEYARAFNMPLWKALFLLCSRPYTVLDRPKGNRRATDVLHDVLHNDRRNKKKEERMNECNLAASEPVRGLAAELASLGMKEEVALDATRRYAKELVQIAIQETRRRFDRLYNPPGFALFLLKSGIAQKFQQAHLATPPPSKEEPMPAYYKPWRELKKELGLDVPERKEPSDLPSFLSLLPPAPPQTAICPACGKEYKKPTTSGLCLRCLDEELKRAFQAKGEQSKERRANAGSAKGASRGSGA